MMTRRDALALPLVSFLPGAFHSPFAFALDDADPTKVFTGDKKPTDVRLGPPRTLNSYFPFAVPKTKEAWEARASLCANVCSSPTVSGRYPRRRRSTP